MIRLRRLYWPLLSLLLVAAGCTEIPSEQQNGLINGYYGCPKSDMTVTDMGVVDIATLHPDMWAPTCNYHWLAQASESFLGKPFVSQVRTKSTGTFKMLPVKSDLPASTIETHLWGWHDPYDPVYTRCPTCDTSIVWAKQPRIKFSLDVVANNMPSLVPGQIDIRIFVDGLVGVSRTWWSPQPNPSDRKIEPGHYEYDFTVPFNVFWPYLYVVVQNADIADNGVKDAYLSVTVTLKDETTTTQPCFGYYPVYPISSSVP